MVVLRGVRALQPKASQSAVVGARVCREHHRSCELSATERRDQYCGGGGNGENNRDRAISVANDACRALGDETAAPVYQSRMDADAVSRGLRSGVPRTANGCGPLVTPARRRVVPPGSTSMPAETPSPVHR